MTTEKTHGTRASATAGSTIVEMLLACTLLTLVLGATAWAIGRGMDVFRQSAANQEADTKVDRAMARVTRDLIAARFASFNPAPGMVSWTENLEFDPVAGYDAANAVVLTGGTRRFELRRAQGELDNGLDDDGDGIVDEYSLVRIEDYLGPNQREVVIVTGIAEYLEGETAAVGDENGNLLEGEPGFCIDASGGTLNVRMSIAKVGPFGDVIVRTRTASILPRN